MGVFQDFRKMTDREILDEVERRLRFVADMGAEPREVVSFYQLELTRRAVLQLLESSTHLERLTKVLIAVTVVLLVVALPAALDFISRFSPR